MDYYNGNEYEHGDQASPDASQGEPQQPNSGNCESQNVSGTYQGAGAGRKESPYADSPYDMHYSQPRQEYSYQPQAPEKKQHEKKPRNHSIWRSVVAAVLVIALVGAGCGITAYSVNKSWEAQTSALNERIDSLEGKLGTAASSNTTTSSNSGTIVQNLPSDGSALTLSQLYSQCVDSVVAISSTVESSSFYGTTEGTASGSGFVLTQDGYIVTNYHVVEDAKSISVTLHDGTEYAATLKGYDSTNDIAVLKVEATGLTAAAIGSSSELAVGDMVVAIGNPLGELTATQTVGYVSGVNREITSDSNTTISMIQTDAAINPGNSGGPLFNMKGEVIGITTAKYSGTTSSGASIEGLGFAIPIDDVVPIINDLIEYGYVTGAYMGITVQNTDADTVSMYGLPSGAYVVEVVSGGSADRAGIQSKDIITALGDATVSNITDLTRALRNYSAGDTTTVTVVRSGQEMTLEITLDEKPQSTDATDSSVPQPDDSMPSEGNYDEWYNWFFGNKSKGNGGK